MESPPHPKSPYDKHLLKHLVYTIPTTFGYKSLVFGGTHAHTLLI